MVGMSGADGLRCGVVTAGALSLPSCSCGSDGSRLSNRIWISPPRAACSAEPAPRNSRCPRAISVRNTRGALVEAQQLEQRRQVAELLARGRRGAADEVEDPAVLQPVIG